MGLTERSWSTGGRGFTPPFYFIIYGLDGGEYWLKETAAPTGYRQILDPIKITITPTFARK